MLRSDFMRRFCALSGLMLGALSLFGAAAADDNRSLGDRTRQYLTDLIRLDTSNPPGNETRVAEYLKQIADAHGIPCELLGSDPNRLNFVARLKGRGRGRPILLMAHSDVAPADPSQWTVDPFGAANRDGFIYGRGAQDDKSLLASEIAVMVELKRRNIQLGRDLILLAEADQQGSSSGIQWMLQHQYSKIDAEFALDEGGHIADTRDGPKIFEVQTTQKVRTRVMLTARGSAAHGSGPHAENAVTHLSRALLKLSDTEEPVRLNAATRRYFRELAKFPQYSWLEPLRRRLEDPSAAQSAARQIRARDPDLDAMLHTAMRPATLNAGIKAPNTASAELEVRRMPGETREDVLTRLRQIVNDPAVEMTLAPSQQMPAAEASSTLTVLYRAIEHAVAHMYPKSTVTPYMSRATTDGNFLRARGMAVYGVPIFAREAAPGDDERISTKNLEDGVELLWQIVLETAGGT